MLIRSLCVSLLSHGAQGTLTGTFCRFPSADSCLCFWPRGRADVGALPGQGSGCARGRGSGSSGGKTHINAESTILRSVGAHWPKESLCRTAPCDAGQTTHRPAPAWASRLLPQLAESGERCPQPHAACSCLSHTASLLLAVPHRWPRLSHQQGCGFPGSGVTRCANPRPFSPAVSNCAPSSKRVSD